MKNLFILFLLAVSFLPGCNEKEEDPIVKNTGGYTEITTDLMPVNRGKRFHFTDAGLSVVTWNPYCDTIEIYNTVSKALISRIIQPNSQGNPFTNVRLSGEGSYLVTERFPDSLKLYYVATGSLIRNLDRVFNWIMMPDNSSILGFSDNLIIKEGVKQINLMSGMSMGTDTFYEINSPSFAGIRNNNSQYVLVDYPIDLNNPNSLTRKARITIKDLTTHQCLARYIIDSQFLINSHVMADDGNLITFVKDDSIPNVYPLVTYDPLSGAKISEGQVTNDIPPQQSDFSTGPGNNQLIFKSTASSIIKQAALSPTYVLSPSFYQVTDPLPNGLAFLDVSGAGALVGVSYTEINNKSHIIIWHAK
jgi:hypothetical protein